jgi:3-dehydroquinate synthase
MKHDKKRKRVGLPFILARGLGDSFLAKDVPLADVQDFLASDLQHLPSERAAA